MRREQLQQLSLSTLNVGRVEVMFLASISSTSGSWTPGKRIMRVESLSAWAWRGDDGSGDYMKNGERRREKKMGRESNREDSGGDVGVKLEK